MPQYDLAGNPLPEDDKARAGSAGSGMPSADPNAPQTDMAGNPLPARSVSAPAWQTPNAALGSPVGRTQTAMSGDHNGVPAQVGALQWNWGAFLLPWLWAFNHKLPGWGIALLALDVSSPFLLFIPSLVSLGLRIYLGLNGHKLAWENRRFNDGFTEFIAVQKAWLAWGFGLLIVWFLMIPVLAAILFPVFNLAREKAREQSGYYRTHPRPASGPGSAGYFNRPGGR